MTFRNAAHSLPVLILFCSTLCLAVPPALDDPLVFSLAPIEGQVGRQVLITGVNFGTAPEVRFNGTLALIDAYRPDMGRLVATVPPTATPGPVTVRNTDSGEISNPASFTVLPGTLVPACTVLGNVTDPAVSPVPGALVVAVDPVAGLFAGMASTDGFGDYVLALPSTGNYELHFIPPTGSIYHEERYPVTCPGAQDHQFAVGYQLSGRVISDTAAPIRNAQVMIEGSFDFGVEILSNATGHFAIRLPADTYSVLVQGPVGGRHISTPIGPLAIGSDTNLGDIQLDTGVVVSGVVLFQDDAVTGPAMGAWIEQYDFYGVLTGTTWAIADGTFWLPSPVGPGFSLWVSVDRINMLEQVVFYVEVTGDMELDHPIRLYSNSGQLPQTPIIVEVDELTVQAGQRITYGAEYIRGTTAAVRFSDGFGGFVDGIDTVIEVYRGGLATTVPPLAASGDVVLRIDGVDSPGYPLTVTGTFIPGPHITSGIVDDGTDPVDNTFVGIYLVDCYGETLVDYDLTAVDGSYSVRHGVGDHFMIFLPPVPSGLASRDLELPGLIGGSTQNVTLQAGHAVTATCVDSGIGTVGGSLPVSDCKISVESDVLGFDDDAAGDNTGWLQLNLPTGEYEFFLEPPFQSRFLSGDGAVIPITGTIDFGNVGLYSGYFIEGYVVDPVGNGLAGVQVTAIDRPGWFEVGGTRTAGQDGRFRLAVPPGTYDLFFEMPQDHSFFAPPLFALEVWQDYRVYPAVQAEDVGYISGTVTDTTPAPVSGVPMTAWHDVYGPVDDAWSCADGSYLLRAPTGDFGVIAVPSDEGFCLANENYNNRYPGCGFDYVSVTAPATVPGIDFTLEPAGAISGLLTDDLGPAVTDVMVCAIAGGSMPFCAEICAINDPDGSYFLPGVPVGVDYMVVAEGGSYPRECWDDHVNCLSYDPVSVAECALTPNIDFLLSGAPGRVPMDPFTAGTPMTADYDQNTGILTIFWQPTCSADNHAVFFGNIGNFSNYTAAECVTGVTGAHPLTPPPGDIFWIVAGASGDRQGSYGVNSDLMERPSDGGALCGYTQDLTATCVP